MPVVTNTVLLPDGSGAQYATVVIRLVANATVGTEAPGYVGTSEILGTFVPAVSSEGVWSLTLTANSLITPSGTVYQISTQIPGRPVVVEYVSVPNGAGPYTVSAILTSAPSSITPTELAAHLADTTSVHGVTDTLIGRSVVKHQRPVLTMVSDTAHTGHGWVAGSGNTGTLNLNDTTVASLPVGTQCITLTTNGAGGVARIDKTGLAIDLTAKSVSVLLMVEDVSKLIATGSNPAIGLVIGDNAFANFFRYDIEAQTATAAANRYLESGQWQRVTFQYADKAFSSGTPNRAALTQLRLDVRDNSAGAAVVHLAQVVTQAEPTSTYPSGVCSFTFDDGYHSAWDAVKYLDKYAMPSMVLPIVNLIGSSGNFLSLAELRTLRDFSQVDVGCHAFTDTSHNLTNAFVDLADGGADEMSRCRDWAIANGFSRGADFFAYPQGRSDATVQAAAKARFVAARGTNSQRKETIPPGDRYRMRICELASAKTLAQAQAYVDAAVADKGWIVFMAHKLGATADSLTWVTSDFQTLVDYVRTSGIAVRSPIDVI